MLYCGAALEGGVRIVERWVSVSLIMVAGLCGCGGDDGSPAPNPSDAQVDSGTPDTGGGGPVDASGDGPSAETSVDVGAGPDAAIAPKGESLILFGGVRGAGSDLNDTWAFDGKDWLQLSPKTRPTPHGAGATGSLGAKVVIFGGSNVGGYLDETWVFDGADWSQVTATPHPGALYGGAMAALGSEVVLYGGRDESAGPVAGTWTFDGATWTDKMLTGPGPRQGHGMTSVPGSVLLYGGSGPYDTYRYDGSSWKSVPTTGNPSGGLFTPMGALGSDVFLITNVISGGDLGTWRFDGATWSMVTAATKPPSRNWPSLARLGDKLILFGGDLNDTWSFDGADWTLVPTTHKPPARRAAFLAPIKL